MKRNDLPGSRPLVRLVVAVLGASTMIFLSGCATPTPSPAHVVPATQAPSSEPSADTGVRDELLVMRFSATATADTGATARVVETVYAPHPITSTERDMLTKEPCPDWESVSPGFVGLPVRVTTTEKSGSWPKLRFVSIRADYLSDSHAYTASAWDGAWTSIMAYCVSGLAEIPGDATGIVMIDPKRAADDDSWGKGTWGLTAEYGEDRPLKVKLSGCSIEIGPAASASPHLAAMTTADATHGCVLGWNE